MTQRDSGAPAAEAADLRSFLETFARALAPLVARELAERAPAGSADPSMYASCGPLPPGVSKRRFLDCARRGDFPSSKRGKVVYADGPAVRAWLASGARPAGSVPVAPPADVASIVADVKRGRR